MSEAKEYKRRTHSTIDLLPKQLQEAIMLMVVDSVWPDDHKGARSGKPRYKDAASYIAQKGHNVSVYAVGRYARRLRHFARMKDAGQTVRDVMSNLNNEKASATQKATAELITAVIIDSLANGDEPTIEDLKNLAKAVKDCAWVSMKADEYIRQRIAERVEKADKNISLIGKKKRIDPETLKAIKEQVYGIIDDKLGISPGR
ncbi:MAG: DUF3486 family protein [Planctomycetes bacterium]|nr:DUF3486 family protein [Planctomycetota bacterium]